MFGHMLLCYLYSTVRLNWFDLLLDGMNMPSGFYLLINVLLGLSEKVSLGLAIVEDKQAQMSY